jgi:PAS domain S-box-containing protein
MDRFVTISHYRVSHTDLVRFWVIASLAISSTFVTALALAGNIDTIYPQLFYFPILYASYFFPRRGIYVAGSCAVAYEAISYYYSFPNLLGMGYATGQGIFFICIGAAVSYFTDKIKTSEARYRSIFEYSQIGIVLFDQNTFAVTLANDQFGAMLGYTAEELAKTPFSHLFFNRDEQRSFYERFGSSEEIVDFETRLATRGSEPFYVNLSWSRLNGNLVSCSVIDVNTRTQGKEAAEDHAARYRQVTESSPTGIVIIQNMQIIYTNPSFTTFSGYARDDLIGRELSAFVHADDVTDFQGYLKQAETPPLPSGKTEFRFLTRTGETKLATLFSTMIKQGGKPALLVNIVDISEREKLKDQIEQDSERRRGVISTVAHELRTPLQPIMGYLNLLMQDPKGFGLTDETKNILDRCLQSVDRERQIINQMLEFSVLDSGKTDLDYSTFSLSALLKNIIETGGYMMKADIAIEIPLDVTFEADQNKIYVVINSMLSNAVNYSKPPRRIKIIYRSSSSDTHHRLAIQDNGVGITGTQLDAIFEPFQLADSEKLSRKYDRIGLSLSIAKKYIQMHGGYISVDSIVRVGSTFTIHIPKIRPKEVVKDGT